MPSDKSARVAKRRRARNQPIRTRTRTLVAKARSAIAAGDAASEEAVREAVVALDKAARKGTIHPRNASRRKSRLMKRLNASRGQ